MANPYTTLPQKSFWRTAVAEREYEKIDQLWEPKFNFLPSHKIATQGSCFAQHFGKALAARGFSWFDAEPAPRLFSASVAQKYNYAVFSARTGNIYTAAALKQWVFWALGAERPPGELWEKDGRYYDPFRPAIEPNGFRSPEELLASREATLGAIRRIINQADRFVFTLGLTEAWRHRSDGYTYAMCPGTVAGEFDPAAHQFHNFRYDEILADLTETFQAIRRRRADLQFLLTVSPVPLTATACGKHVLTATTYSKSTLRAVAGVLADDFADIDYFPSYEIITAPPFGGRFYEPNKRSVTRAGVDFVMQSFFRALEARFGSPAADGSSDRTAQPKPSDAEPVSEESAAEEDELVCEELMLEAFAR